MRPRSSLLALTLAVATALAAAAPAHARAPRPCAATFHVLHDDAVGELRVPAGQYHLAVDAVSCARASQLFAEFLDDFNGVLPRPWRYSVAAPGRGTFRGRGDRFTVTRAAGVGSTGATPGPATEGGGSHGDLRCRGTFDVEHRDRVGPLRIPAGDYTITLLGGNLACTTAKGLLGRFLRRRNARLRGGWVVLAGSGEFVRSSSHHGFRIKPAID
jgi:hypothetical protein